MKISFSLKAKSDFILPDKTLNKSCPDLKKLENKDEQNKQRKLNKLMGG